jgi:hypothetical protein
MRFLAAKSKKPISSQPGDRRQGDGSNDDHGVAAEPNTERARCTCGALVEIPFQTWIHAGQRAPGA